MRAAGLILAVGLLIGAARAHAQSPVERLDTFMLGYEPALATIVARELYRQSETVFPPAESSTTRNVSFRNRTLESEVAFLRLPGDREWFGVRHVLRIDRRQLKQGRSLLDVLKAPNADISDTVRAIVKSSSQHNIGPARTVNMPTVPLELLHPRNRHRMTMEVGSSEVIDGVVTQELRYRENGSDALIRDADGAQMIAQGSVWIQPTGALRRVTLRLLHSRLDVQNRRTGDNELRVDFRFDEAVKLLVPFEMREEFELRGGGQFKGRATYSDFRRFTTSARIVPQS